MEGSPFHLPPNGSSSRCWVAGGRCCSVGSVSVVPLVVEEVAARRWSDVGRSFFFSRRVPA